MCLTLCELHNVRTQGEIFLLLLLKKITHTQFSPVCQSAAVNEDRRRPTENALTCKIGVYSFLFFFCNHVLYMLAKKLATEKKESKKTKQTNQRAGLS